MNAWGISMSIPNTDPKSTSWPCLHKVMTLDGVKVKIRSWITNGSWGECWKGNVHTYSNVKQQEEETRHGSKERREVRKGAKGSQNRTRGGTGCTDVRNDTVNTSTTRSVDWACGSNNVDDDTRERKKRETVTETKRKRLLIKRTREGGSKGGKAATEREDANTDDWSPLT